MHKSMIQILLIISYCHGEKRIIAYPTSIQDSWNIATKDSIKCPMDQINVVPENPPYRVSVKVRQFRPKDTVKVSGYTCHKISLDTICVEDTWLASDVTHQLRNLPISGLECHEAVNGYLRGNRPSMSHPPPECGWRSTKIQSRIVVIVNPHDVIRDPYTGDLIDRIFRNGSISSNESETIFDSVIWVSRSNTYEDTCSLLGESIGTIFFDDYIPGDGLIPNGKIWDPHLSSHSFKGSCQLRFCKLNGIRFPNGDWAQLTLNEFQGSDLNSMLREIPACASNIEVKIPTTFHLIDNSLTKIMAHVHYVQCQNIISKWEISHKLSHFDLSFLHRHTPGRGSVFKIRNQTLYMSTGVYEYITIDKGNNTSPNIIGYDSMNKAILNYDWDTVQGVRSGINGISYVGSEVIFPLESYEESEVLEVLHSNKEIGYYHHPLVLSAATTMNLTDLYEYSPQYNSSHIKTLESLSDSVTDHISNFFSFNFGSTLIKYLIIIIIIFLVYKYISTYIQSRARKAADESFELSSVAQVTPIRQNRDGRYWS